MKRILIITLTLLCFVISIGKAQYSSVNRFLSVTGSGYVSVPYAYELNENLGSYGALSIDAWVYPSTIPKEMTIVGNDWKKGYWFGVTSQGRLRFYPNGNLRYDGKGAIPTGQWSHVAVSLDVWTNSLRFYINGKLDISITIPQTYIGYNTTDLRIGADRLGKSPDYYWQGHLDEVRIWNSSIAFDFASGLLYKIPHGVYYGKYGRSLVAGWRLNGNATGIAGRFSGSLSGSGTYRSAPDPPHYSRICAIFRNRSGRDLFDEDYFEIRHSSSISFVQNFTLECWVKPSSKNGNASYQTFIQKGSQSGKTWSYWLGLNKSNRKVRFVPNGDFNSGLESSIQISSGSWTHVAARYRFSGGKRTATLFINGTFAGSKTYSKDASPNQYALLIGRSDTEDLQASGYGFSGSIDEVRLWSVARSDDEIRDNYRREFGGPQTGLVGAYHFDGDIIDYSGKANDGNHTLASSSYIYFLNASDLPSQPTVRLITPNGGNTYDIGTTVKINWTATGLHDVRLKLSRDGGKTYNEIIASSVAAKLGFYIWVATGPETQNARVQVTTPSPTPISDESNKSFTIVEPIPVMYVWPQSLSFTAFQNGNLPPSQTVFLQNTNGGTLVWDATPGSLGWMEVSPATGNANIDSFHVSMTTTDMQEGVYYDQVTVGGNAVNAGITINVRYLITTKPVHSIAGRVSDGKKGIGNVKITVTGEVTNETTTNPDGSYSQDGLPEGNYTVTPVSPYYDFSPSSRALEPLNKNEIQLNFLAKAKRGAALLRYKKGWNLISLPLVPSTSKLTALFPDADEPAYYYAQDSGYVSTTSLVFGIGYWVRFKRTDSVTVQGMLQGTMEAILRSAFGGWNLIGMTAGPLLLGTIEQVPENSIQVVYEYDPYLGYFLPIGGVLRPGRAYFVKVVRDVSVRFVSSTFAPYIPPWNSFTFPSAKVIRDGVNLPPPPPPME
ncbi:MAG: hypothetical protein GXO82_10905 [Chlorobi bacterium]|nr:hypothetical protein [Chlorobiota bacterium]